jgi:hypothetical protein
VLHKSHRNVLFVDRREIKSKQIFDTALIHSINLTG